MFIFATEEKRICAFTLVELMIMTVIIGILSMTAVVKYNNVSEKARSAEAYSALALIVSAENAYRTEKDIYTSTIAQLDIEAPVSLNFQYEISSLNLTSGYASAKGIVGKAKNSYGMCLKNGKKNTTPCAVNVACNPTCP